MMTVKEWLLKELPADIVAEIIRNQDARLTMETDSFRKAIFFTSWVAPSPINLQDLYHKLVNDKSNDMLGIKTPNKALELWPIH